MSYGLKGNKFATISSHKYCPMITENCCLPEDETISMQIWEADYGPKIERYYEVYLYAVKYILGFSSEGLMIAKDYEDSTDSSCKEASKDYIKMNINPRITMEIYKSFASSIDSMANIRKGFYCTICDAKTQEKLADFWQSTNWVYADRIYFSKEFCQELVDQTIRSSYFTVYYLKNFAEQLTRLMNCKSGNKTNLEFEIPFWTKQQVKHCFYFKNKYFFFFCEKYCQKFHLTKASDIFDGNLGELRKFYEHIKIHKDNTFYYPSNNILMDGVTYEEDYLTDYMNQVMEDPIFMKPVLDNKRLDKF